MNSEWDPVQLSSSQNIVPKKTVSPRQQSQITSFTYVSICSIAVVYRSIFCHRNNCDTQVNSQWINIEKSEKCQHNHNVSSFLPKHPCQRFFFRYVITVEIETTLKTQWFTENSPYPVVACNLHYLIRTFVIMKTIFWLLFSYRWSLHF